VALLKKKSLAREVLNVTSSDQTKQRERGENKCVGLSAVTD
jgi:hypothetical protein